MTDQLERVISLHGDFFGVACDTTELVREACRRHDVGPTAAAALGRALTGAALLAALLKDSQSVMLRFEGNGPLGKIITEAGYDGWVRGYVGDPLADVPLRNGRIDVAAGIGHAGFLTVTKTISQNQKYPGTIQLYTSEIGDDIAYYLSQSEQTPSAVALAIHLEKDGTIAACGGFLVQSLPPADESLLTNIESAMTRMEPLSSLLLAGKTPSAILSMLFSDVPHRKIGSIPLEYRCSCSRQKMINALFSLGEAEVRDILAKENEVDVCCEFCRLRYLFSTTELAEILLPNPSSNN